MSTTTTTRLPLATADEVAAQVLELLKPHCHCERIHIAGLGGNGKLG